MAASSSMLSYYTFLNIFFFLLIEKNSLVSASGLAEEYHLINVESLLPSNSCSMPDKGMSPPKLKLVHQCGPCSPLACQDKLSLEDKSLQFFKRDQARIAYNNRLDNANSTGFNPIGDSLSTIVPMEGVFAHTHNFIFTIYLGTPPMPYSLVFDTGSDLTWTQCIPCEKCYPQIDPIYNPFESSTYASIRCYSDYCTQLANRNGCSWIYHCLYNIQYDDGSYIKGYLVQDTLKFSSNIIENFRYGCGVNNNMFGMRADGLMGFGRGSSSIITQTAQSFDMVFSFCLPSKPSIIGYLALGNDVTPVQYTPMLTNENMPSHYYVNLMYISIGVKWFALSPTVFNSLGTMSPSGRRTKLDIRLVINRLPPITYYDIRSTFRKYMANYPRAPSLSILDTCYNFTNYPKENVKVPPIKFKFDGGVIIKLDISGILIGTSISQKCLAFAANKYASDQVRIGNAQLRTFHIVYDINNLRIGFGANGCS